MTAATVITAASIVLAIFVYVRGGLAHWALIDDHHARSAPLQHEACSLTAGLRSGDWAAHFVKWCFVLLWPAWLALGFLLTKLSSIGEP